MALTLSGFQVNEQVFKSERTLIHRGLRVTDNVPVVIKQSSSQYPSHFELARLKHEYEVLAKLDIDGVSKAYSLEKHHNGLALILEAFDGSSLAEVITSGKTDLATFLDFAAKMAAIIGSIHDCGIIHKDINPRNFLLNGAAGEFKVIDFGLASYLQRQEQEAINPGLLEGSLPYMSPEQTGRMNRGIDYRTDYYSLGITFYEILTGAHPFQADDAIGWVHCHIAKTPPPIRAQRPDIPPVVENIVLKLMSKKAEDRYNSMAGLIWDLEKCRKQISQNGKAENFTLGIGDVSAKFHIPQKLYGRAAETGILEDSFARVADGGAEMLMVAGYSGIGKSALVNEIHKPLVEKYGFFISGKFDQFQRHIPYSAISGAFQGLLKQLLMSPREELVAWKDRLLAALGPNGQVIIDVIPALEKIIGPQPRVADLGTEETQNRFNMVFLQFLRVFTRKASPLAIFLDDLQWADIATLNLIKTLMLSEGNEYLLLMGAYRDNEVDHTHPFMIALDEIVKAGVRISELVLKPLDLDHLNELIADTVHADIAAITPLSKLIMDKTGGNPFFVIQFLKNLHHENLLTFDAQQQRWTWNIAQIESRAITDNVVEFMVKKLKTLPDATQNLLRLGACIGNSFDLKTLAIIAEQPIADIARDLWPAVEEGLLLPQGGGHHQLKMLGAEAAADSDRVQEAVDKFLHDRVQQAAYSLIAEDQKKATHLKIARLLLKSTHEQDLGARCFSIVEHYNKSASLIADDAEKLTLAALNLDAGRRAQKSTAYAPALEYFSIGSGLLGDDTWRNNHALMFGIHKGMTECQFLTGKFEEGIASADNLLKRCSTKEEKVEINNVLILYYGGAGQMDKSIDLAIDSLALYHESLPRKCNQVQLLLELASTKLRELGKNVDHLMAMPRTQNADALSVLSLLKELVAPTYLQGLLLLPFVILRMFKLTLIHGNSSISSFIFSAYGLLWSKLGIPSEAYKYGKLAMEYNKQVDNPPMEARTYFMVTSFAMFWKQPIRDTIEPRRQGLQKLVNTGENFWASYIYLFGFWQEAALSKSVADVAKMAEREARFARKVKQTEPFHIHSLHRGLFMNLAGEIQNPDSLDYPECDEQQAVAFFDSNVTSTCGTFYHATTRLVLNYYHGRYKEAVAAATGPKITAEVIADPTYNVTIYTFFTCLAILAALPDASDAEKTRYRKVYASGMGKIRKWARCGAANFNVMLSLLTAEEARLDGRAQDATNAYTQAIQAAKEMDSLFYESLCNECCAEYWLGTGEDKIARVYMQEASFLYDQWGAAAKVKQLRERYPALLSAGITKRRNVDRMSISLSGSTSTTTVGQMDMSTVLKASQAISSEIVLGKLLEKLINILIENAGARRGVLILKQDARLYVEAEGDAQTGKVTALQAIPLEEAEGLPLSLIRYVTRTEETIVLGDATRESLFTGDSYVKSKQPKSLLLMPITNYGKLLGILYLENELIEEVFTPERMELLKVLAAQIAISIENSLFYTSMEKKVEERTAELQEALADLKRSQQQLVESEKMAALGQLVAGVGHEVNTPLGAIKSSIGNIDSCLKGALEQLPRLFQMLDGEQQQEFMSLLTHSEGNGAVLTTREEREIRKSLEEELKGHGIENARNLANIFIKLKILKDVTPYLPLLRNAQADFIFDTAYKLCDLRSNAANIAMAVERASKIIFALKNFARFDQSGEMIKARLKDGLETVLTIYHNQIKRNTTLVTEYQDLEEIYCFPDELNQVWTNLIHNALQAMDYSGTLTIRLEKAGDCQKVVIQDSGQGIAEDIIGKIFAPFFTTKKAGEGSGLGLDIVKKIVDKHNGRIEVASTVGVGTAFSVFIPAIVTK
jgi:predicted ATPase/signal transduction histidine kinase/tRNA A-37 threonylcarbamoyl transferase component Bud32